MRCKYCSENCAEDVCYRPGCKAQAEVSRLKTAGANCNRCELLANEKERLQAELSDQQKHYSEKLKEAKELFEQRGEEAGGSRALGIGYYGALNGKSFEEVHTDWRTAREGEKNGK